MGEPQLQETDKRAALEGLEEIFDVGVGQAQSEAHPAQDQAQPEAQGQAQTEAHVPIADASRLLGIDRRYTLRLVHMGKLAGCKDSDGRWRVSIESINSRLGLAQSEAHPAQDQAQSEAQAEAQELDSFKDRLLIELQSKVEALTWRNGYLESQLQERDKEIKLLTDSQHKSGWWARFCSWLASR